MIQNKKGLSAVITTLLVIVLVLVAVGIVWGVVNNIIQGGAESTQLAADCLSLDIQATVVDCTVLAACDVTFERTGSSDTDPTGAKLVFRNADGTAGTNNPVTALFPEGVPLLIGEEVTDLNSGLDTPTEEVTVSVEVTVYFEDASGNEQLCPGDPSTFSFAIAP